MLSRVFCDSVCDRIYFAYNVQDGISYSGGDIVCSGRVKCDCIPQKIGRILSEFGVLAAVCLVSFPMVFTAVRMIPAVVNDPVRYDIEFQDKSFMIYEGDPIDSDKYMTVRRFFDTLFGRFQTQGQHAAVETEGLVLEEAGELALSGLGLQGLTGGQQTATQERTPARRQIFPTVDLLFFGIIGRR